MASRSAKAARSTIAEPRVGDLGDGANGQHPGWWDCRTAQACRAPSRRACRPARAAVTS